MDPLSHKVFLDLSAFMRQAVGLHFGDNKMPLVSSRLAPRIRHSAWTATATTWT